MARTIARTLGAVLVLAACSGGDPATEAEPESTERSTEATAAADSEAPSAEDDSPAESSTDDAPGAVQVNGEALDMTPDICALGGAFGTEDDRQFSAAGASGFPNFAIELFMPDMYSATYSNADGTANYRTNDLAAFNVSITATGAQGSVEMVDTSGQSEPVTVTFAFTCDEVDAEAGTGGSEESPATDDGTDSGSEPAAGTKTGFVEWAGSRSDLDDADFDPSTGTGLCETEDVTGLESGDYYRISTTLADGTDFYLTNSDGLVLGDTFSPVDVSGLSVTQDGRTVSGTAQTPDGALEFIFSC